MSVTPRITFLGQSGFYIESTDSKLLIDPSNKKSGELDGDIVYCTHNHMDHVGGVKVFMARNPDAILLGNDQVLEKFPQFADRAIHCHEGMSQILEPWNFEFKQLPHGFFKGVLNLAIVARIGEFSFAHCGDAVSFDGFPPSPVNVLAIPIGGAFAASPRKALSMIKNLEDPIPTIVPMHWLLRNPREFCKKLMQTVPDANCIVPIKKEPLKGFE